MVDESADYALLRVTVSGHRTFAITVNAKIFVSSKFQPRAGKHNICIHMHVLLYCIC